MNSFTTFTTSLGLSIEERGELWELDLTNLRVFKGLSVLSSIIADLIIDKVENSPGDIFLFYKINPNINPELTEMHISYIEVYARKGILKDIPNIKEEFHNQLRTVFGTFQRPSWGKKIHPEFYGDTSNSNANLALIFPFHYASDKEEVDYQFILERVEINLNEYFLRLTVENHFKENLNLNSIPHIIVDDLKTRTYIAGSTKIAEVINDSIQSSCTKGLTFYSEDYRFYSHLFEQLEKTHIGRLDSINFYWEKNFSAIILREQPANNIKFIKKLLLVLEDSLICNGLKSNKELKIYIGRTFITIYLSHLNRVLNFSINLNRKKFSPAIYLNRMPELEALSLNQTTKLNFERVNIFLIHHITSEIISLIEAFRRLKANKLYISFVKYGGVVPSNYLSTLLDIPKEFIFMLGLTRKITLKGHEYYTIADYYSDTKEYAELKKVLDEKKLKYFEAMKLLACNMFLRFCLESIKTKNPILLIEDGGYLAPLLNEISYSNKTVSEVFKEYFLEVDSKELFSEWIKQILIGSIEHTRNGYNRLVDTQKKYNKLFLPSYSIAISNKKTIIESKEVAHSILSAIESILHSHGMVLSSRNVIVLGSGGNIGKFLVKYLKDGRLEPSKNNLVSLDICYDSLYENQFQKIEQIPVELLCGIDLFIGVIGDSVLTKEYIEAILLNSKKTRLVFASGSTKNLEFYHLSEWIDEVLETESIQGIPIKISYDRLIDPQTGIEQGGKVLIEFESKEYINKTLYLLGDLTPINFLFYGVPTETMDMIISQLTTVSLGMVHQYKNRNLPESLLYAVDREIDEWGNRL